VWIFTRNGFCSVVQHKHASTVLIVRCRCKEDADKLRRACNGTAVQDTPESDYRYRFLADRKEFAAFAAKLVEEIDYPNFKDEVHAVDPSKERSEAYLEVWSSMYNLQQKKSGATV